MSIDVYPPKGLLVPGTELVTETLAPAWWTSTSPGFWLDSSAAYAAWEFILPAQYAGGSLTFTLRRRALSVGVAVMTWASYRIRPGTDALTLVATTPINLTVANTNTNEITLIVAGTDLLPGDTIRVDVSRDGSHASDTLTNFVLLDGFALTYLATTPRVFNAQPYEEGSFTVTATGFSGTAPSGTARYVRVGKQVTLALPQLAGTSNATTFTVTGMLPALRSATTISVVTRVMDNGVTTFGYVLFLSTDDTLHLGKDAAGSVFTASGTKNMQAITCAYIIP